jgi:hypothetical protein
MLNMDLEWIDDVLDAANVRPRHFHTRVENIEKYTEEEFRSRFRLRKDTFIYLLEKISEKLEPATNRNHSISASLQLLITLRILSGGSFQTVSGDVHGVSQSTVSRIFLKVTNTICSLRKELIHFPDNLAAVKQAFLDYGGFPGVVGCVDGTHIPILKPSHHAQTEIYRCRKGYFSLNVQLVCGPDHSVYNVVARWPGSTHDSRVFSNSKLMARMENNEINGILLADSGYPCKR